MKYLSLFSGIESATVAWKDIGFTPVAFAETDSFANALLQYHYPGIPNLGDVREITTERLSCFGDIDLVVGGSPCVNMSVASRKRVGIYPGSGELRASGLVFEMIRILSL